MLFFSCIKQLKKTEVKTECNNCNGYERIIKKTLEFKEDSSLISYAVDRWIEGNYGSFGQYKKKTPNDWYKIHIGAIFYNNMKLKMTAFLYIEYNVGYVDTMNVKFRDVKSHFFDSHTLMGYRDSSDKPWKLFELNEVFSGSLSRSLKQAVMLQESKMLNRKYLTDTAFIAVYNKFDKANTTYKAVKYLPCESLFWTESPLWQKGNRIKGYYPFETHMNATPFSKMPLIDIFNIHYPDSINKFYR